MSKVLKHLSLVLTPLLCHIVSSASTPLKDWGANVCSGCTDVNHCAQVCGGPEHVGTNQLSKPVWNLSPPARLPRGGVLGFGSKNQFVQRVQDGHADAKRQIRTAWTCPVRH